MARRFDIETGPQAGTHEEGTLTTAAESVTAEIPSGTYLAAALGAMAVSAALQVMGRHHFSLFVGQWAPAFLIMGLYNKLVKVAGSGRSG